MGYFPGVGAFEQQHVFGPGRGEFNTTFPKIQMLGGGGGGGGGMLKLQFEWLHD